MNLFEYAVIKQPKVDKEGAETDPGAIVVAPTAILAKDASHVTMLAAREIPEADLEEIDRLTVLVRPFA